MVGDKFPLKHIKFIECFQLQFNHKLCAWLCLISLTHTERRRGSDVDSVTFYVAMRTDNNMSHPCGE